MRAITPHNTKEELQEAVAKMSPTAKESYQRQHDEIMQRALDASKTACDKVAACEEEHEHSAAMADEPQVRRAEADEGRHARAEPEANAFEDPFEPLPSRAEMRAAQLADKSLKPNYVRG